MHLNRTDSVAGLSNRQTCRTTSYKKPTKVWLWLGIGAIALIAWTVGLVFPVERQFRLTLQHTRVMVIAMDMLSTLKDAEGEDNGFLITGEASYRQALNLSHRDLDEEFDRLRKLAEYIPQKQQQIETLQYVVQQELSEFQKLADVRAEVGFEAARARVRTGRSKQLMTAIRIDLRRMVLDEQTALALFTRDWQSRLGTGLVALVGSALLASCFLMIGRIVVARSASQRERAEKELQTSERRFETLCEQAPVGIYETDANGRCIYTNRKWSAISGLSASESLGHGWKEAFHPDDREAAFQEWQTFAQQGTTWEYRLLTSQGNDRWIRATGGPVYSERGPITGYVGTIEDVTERKRAAERFRLVFEAAPCGMVMLDRDGKIVLVNSRAEELFGYRREELLGNSIEILVPESSGDGHEAFRREYFIQPVERPMGMGRDLYARRKDGTQFPVEIGLNPIETEEGAWTLSSILDITDRKLAEDAQREALQQLQLITDNMPAGVSRCSRDLCYLWVNHSYAAWLGRTLGEIANRPILDVIGQEVYENVLPHLEKALSGEREEYEAPVNYLGTGVRWIHAVLVPTRGQNREVDGWIAVVTDVTERHEAEERLRESEERFRNMADTAPVMIWMSGEDKLCTFFNKAWLEFTGRTMDQESENGWAEGVHADDLDRSIATYSASFDARRPFRMEYRLRRADGEYRWILDDGTPRFTAGGIFAGYIGSCIDITEKRRAEDERQKFVSLADRSLEFVGMCDLDFRPFYINSAGLQLVGLDDLEAACRVKVQDYFFPEDQAFITNEFFPRVQRDGHRKVEIRFRHFKTGEAIWMLYNVFSIFDARGAIVGWATVSIDVTERKKAEDALREAMQQLQLVTDNMPAAVARFSRDLRYVWVNRSYAAWRGREPTELVGRSIVDGVGQEGYEMLRPHIEKVLSGQRDEFEILATFLPGGARWFHDVYVPTVGEDLKVDGWIALIADVTERREAEERLRESEERFRVTFYQAAVGIAQTSIDGHWQLLNDRFCEIVGYSQDELREKTFTDVTHPDDREASLTASRSLLAGKIPSWSSEKRYIRKDGVIVWAKVFVSLVRDKHSQPQYFVSVVEDITEKIQAERALQRSRQELRALTGRLINAEEEERKRISRELHDDLSQKLAMLAFDAGSLILTPPASVEEMKGPLHNLQTGVVQLSQNVRQISHQLHPSILDDLGLTAALTELCEEFSARHGIEVMVEQEAVPRDLSVEIASCLYRVTQEALHNVLKHAQASQVRLRVSGSPEGIHLYIHDTGVGFDSEASTSRLGLGIVSMKERVRLVEGEFSIHSQRGQGTEVRVFVPL